MKLLKYISRVIIHFVTSEAGNFLFLTEHYLLL